MLNPDEFSRYRTGHEELDRQHFELFEHLGTVRVLVSAGRLKEAELARDVFASVLRDHFAYEERLMDEADYPFLYDHKEAHRASMRNPLNALLSGGVRNVVGLSELLIDHIEADDAAFCEFLRAQS